jgi:putative membrane-bound dehydrogenase-like protein
LKTALIALSFLTGSNLASADDLPPSVTNSQNPKDVSLTPAESLKLIEAPDGFHVTLFAGEPDIRRPIAFDFDDRGRLWVVENYSHPVWKADSNVDRIVILEDTDHDGRFDKRKVFWDKGRYLTGICWGHGGVWIANTPELGFIPDRDGDDVPDGEPVAVLDGFQRSSNNVVNNLHWGPDGWLYGAIGLSDRSMVGKPGANEQQRTRITRGMWRYHPTRGDFEVLAEGMVNPWGADFNAYGDLFTTNTVIAHLWHIVPGMYCQRRGTEVDFPYAYGRIQSITDHLHWGGGRWQASRAHEDRHSVACGGHAHCGAMIYLGDNWPKKYRGTFFTANLHGGRLNNDLLAPNKSTYVGVHSDDMMFANDPWFRGLSVKYGPDGGVYVSDWHDFGECHDNDGSHRSSGRIYKMVYGEPPQRSVDLQRMKSLDLAQLHLHANEWMVRRARRNLHERAVRGDDLTAAAEFLRRQFADESNEVHQLRALWTRYVIGDLEEAELLRLMRHDNLHIRRWAVRLSVDGSYPSAAVRAAMANLADSDPAPQVRLALASALRKLDVRHREPLVAGLVKRAEDASDPYLPLMIWYGAEPLARENPTAALNLASRGKIPTVRRYMARRLLDLQPPRSNLVVAAALQSDDQRTRFDLMQGMLDSLEPQGAQSPPEKWPELYRLASSSANPALRSTAVRLATIFGDQRAIAKLRKQTSDESVPFEERRDALRALMQLEKGVTPKLLHRLVQTSAELRRDAIRALLLRNDQSTPQVLLDVYSDLDVLARQEALSVLATRRSFAAILLNAIESRQVDRRDVTAFTLQQLRNFDDAEITTRVSTIWADDSQRLKKSDEIARYQKLLSPAYLKAGDIANGRQLFEQTCAKCHTLFGSGGNIGPDLTGSGRRKTDYVLSNLIDPSAIVDPAFRLTRVITTDGRVLSGFMIQHTERFVVLRTQDARLRLAMDDIDDLSTSPTSMMPEGMLHSFSDEQVRDLVLYLASPDQVSLDE